jgi:hypothetical protein
MMLKLHKIPWNFELLAPKMLLKIFRPQRTNGILN